MPISQNPLKFYLPREGQGLSPFLTPTWPQTDNSKRHTLRNRMEKEATLAMKISESLGLIGDKIEGLSINQQTD